MKFSNLKVTDKGLDRAYVDMIGLTTLWFNTGTLCNLSCANCYIESTPTNDALVYLTLDEVLSYLDEIRAEKLPVREIGITGGEPFMNPYILPIMEACLERGFDLLVLTNAMRPMMKCADGLLDLRDRYGDKLTIRVSVDHFTPELHEEERGEHSWSPMIKGLKWLGEHGFNINIAGRTCWGGCDLTLRKGFATLFGRLGLKVDAHDPKALMLFPEMNENDVVPEITTKCWKTLGVSPDDMMCSNSRMVVKRKGAAAPVVLACTLVAFDDDFEVGATLKESLVSVFLNHPHCSKFCVLGGGSCSK